MSNFNATKNFRKNIHDMKFMLEYAEKSEDAISSDFDPIKSKILNNSSFILIMSNCENFIENIFSDFVNKLNELKVDLPEEYYKQHIKNSIYRKEIKSNTDINLNTIVEQIYKYINKTLIDKIVINNKFTFGRHGSDELNKLFKRIGIENLCSKIEIFSYNKSISGLEKERIDFQSKFDEMTSKRNNILHEYSMPSLTSKEILDYIRILGIFSRKLDTLLNNEFNKLNTLLLT